MSTMKLFRNLFIGFILLNIFVSYMSKAFIMSTYTPIKDIEIVSEAPKIEILEAKATTINGFVLAKITNNTDYIINDKYIKLDFYSKYENRLGTKYLKVNNLNKGESKEFKLDHRFYGVTGIKGEIIDHLPETEKENYSIELTKQEKFALTVGGLIAIYYMPTRFLFGIFPF